MPFTSQDQQAIVQTHNTYRSDPAVNTPNLQWDSTLATGAQTWADNLATNVHKLQHSDPNARQGLGENIASATTGSNTPAQLVDVWGKTVVQGRSEQAQFKPGIYPNVSKDNGTVGHYTQTIWRTTTSVGCGIASDSTTGQDYLVCRYSPAGNMSGVGVPSPQPVTLAQVSCGSSANIWGVDAANTVYSYGSSDGTNWTQTQMPGQMKLVSAASDNTVWGLDPNGAAWKFDWNAYAWTQGPSGGPFKYLSCGLANNIGALGTDNQFYRNTGSGWTLADSGVWNQVTVADDGTTWALSSNNYPRRYTGSGWDASLSNTTGWQFPQISCGSATNLWGMGLNSQYYKYTGSGVWTQAAPGTGKQVSVASDGTVWALGTDNRVSRLVNNAWTPLLV